MSTYPDRMLRLELKMEELRQKNKRIEEQLRAFKEQNSILKSIVANKTPLTTGTKFHSYCETYPWAPCARIYDV